MRTCSKYLLLLVWVGAVGILGGSAWVQAPVMAAQSYAVEVTADNPFGWWHLNDARVQVVYTAVDSGSGNHNGTYAATVFTAAGIAGAGANKAADFEGGYIDVGSPADFDSGGAALTIEAWVQPNSAGDFQWIVGKDNSNTALDYLLGINANGTFRFLIQGIANDLVNANGPSTFDGATWYYVAGVQDPTANQVRLYVNGALVGSQTIVTTGVTASNKLRIGARGNSATTQQVKGRIDEVAIYKAVLSDDRILEHYNQGLTGGDYAAAVAADSPYGWWRLNDAIPPKPPILTTADSGSGAHTGTYIGAVFDAPGIIGTDRAADFQGGRVVVDDPAAFDSAGANLTVEGWIQPAALGSFQWILGKDDDNTALDYLLGMNADGKCRFITQGLANDIVAPTAVIANGLNWYHVVGVQDATAGTVYLYVNGVEVVNKTITANPKTAVNKLHIGARGNTPTSQTVNGRLDEVAIYKTALSAAQILAHYNNGLSDAAAVLADNPFGWWRFNDAPVKQVFRATDSGSGKNDGTYSDTVLAAAGIPGAPDGAANFQRGYVYIDNPAAFDSGASALTVEAWVQPDVAGGWILGKDNDNTALDYLLGFNGAAFRYIAQGLTHDMTGGGPLVINGTTWHHVVAVQDPDSGNIRLYADGVLAITKPIATTGVNASNKLRIGTRGNDAAVSQAVSGRIDEVAIYKSVLSEARIQAHYQAGITPPSPPPSLTIQNSVTVSWPTTPPGYVLQWATDVSGPYENYTGSIFTEGNNYLAPVPTGPTQKFFQLVKP